jgi:mevalonate kinase
MLSSALAFTLPATAPTPPAPAPALAPSPNTPNTPTEVSAAGKLILFGEHSVVYGHPALACALPGGLRLRLGAEEGRGEPTLHVPALNLTLTPRPAPPEAGEGVTEKLAHALWLAWERAERLAPASRPPRQRRALTLTGELPFKVGLGSSAALSLCLLRAAGVACGRGLTEEELDEGAWELERLFHATPSGLDHTVSLRGGALLFHRPPPPSAPVYERVSLGAPLSLRVLYTPREGDTAVAVGRVREWARAHPSESSRRFERMGALAVEGAAALRAGDARGVGELMGEAHSHLVALGVSTPALEGLREVLLGAGALGVKLTGAGLGGAVVGVFEG